MTFFGLVEVCLGLGWPCCDFLDLAVQLGRACYLRMQVTKTPQLVWAPSRLRWQQRDVKENETQHGNVVKSSDICEINEANRDRVP